MNLESDERGAIWCPKVNTEISAAPTNMSGCQHCAYKLKMTADNGRFQVTCALVPRIQFCHRIAINNRDWSCMMEPDLGKYREMTGDFSATEVPEGFHVPFQTTFTKCMLCATQRRPYCRPIEEPLLEARAACIDLASPEKQAIYAAPRSEQAAKNREILAEINPDWKDRKEAIESRNLTISEGDVPTHPKIVKKVKEEAARAKEARSLRQNPQGDPTHGSHRNNST